MIRRESNGAAPASHGPHTRAGVLWRVEHTFTHSPCAARSGGALQRVVPWALTAAAVWGSVHRRLRVSGAATEWRLLMPWAVADEGSRCSVGEAIACGRRGLGLVQWEGCWSGWFPC